jgi:hypothetical protein
VFVWLLGCEHYTSQDNTTGKLFPREKTIICLGHKRKKPHCTEIETKLVGIDIVKPHHVNSKCLIDYSAVYSKGGKSCQKYIKIMQENLFHSISPQRKHA